MLPIAKGLAGLAVASVLSSPVGAQGIVLQKNITLGLAQTVANAAIERCRSMGYKISVTVVDREGLPIVMMRDDGAGLHTPEGSDRKAYTARTFSQPSAAFVKRSARGTIHASWRSMADCQSKSVTKSSARSASPARPAKMMSARRPVSTRSPIN
jgi:uncharacterized protein GlcG (DUF336 family)